MSPTPAAPWAAEPREDETMIGTYEIVEERSGVALLRRDDGQGTVVRIDRKQGQVYDGMPGDAPPESTGSWFGAITQAGIDYVASWYSWAYARRIFRQYQREAEEWKQAMSE